MKKQNILLTILFIIAIISIIFAIYKIYKPNNSNKNNIENINVSTSIEKNISNFEEKDFLDKNDFYEISAKYPIDSFDKEKDIETFVLHIIKEKQKEWEIGGEVYNSEKEAEKDFSDRPKMTYSLDISFDKYSSKEKGTVSYLFNIYEFTGGAHGINAINTFTFNKNGKVDIQDILDLSSGDNAIKLSRVLADNLKTKGGDMIEENMMMEGLGLAYLKVDGKTFDNVKCACDGFNFASNFQNFYITDEGMNFVFSQYQIAPGAAGIIKTLIDWNTLSPYILK